MPKVITHIDIREVSLVPDSMYPIDTQYEEDLDNATSEMWPKENPFVSEHLTEIPDPARYLADKYGLPIKKKEVK